jgi:hypothetical protein
MIQRLAHSAALLATIASTAHAQRTAAANCAAVQTQHRTDVKITEAVAVAATRDTTTPVQRGALPRRWHHRQGDPLSRAPALRTLARPPYRGGG